MKMLRKWLIVLLAGCVLLTPVATMEEALSAAEISDLAAVELAEEPAEIQPEAVDSAVAENTEIDLSEGESGDARPLYEPEGSSVLTRDDFEDEALWNYLIQRFGHNDDTSLSVEMINSIELFTVGADSQPVGLGITSLKGIEHLTNLCRLDCSHNPIAEIDLSGNPGLTKLYCYDCKLTALDVSPCPALVPIADRIYAHYNEDKSIITFDNGNGIQLRYNTSVKLIAGEKTIEPGSIVEGPPEGPPEGVPEGPQEGPSDGATGIPIDEAHFPDAAFRQYITDKFDPNHNGILHDSMRESIKWITLTVNNGNNQPPTGLGVTSLQGIEYFPNLDHLNCSYNPITSLDVSMFSKMTVLQCESCALTTLKVGDGLGTLICDNNPLTSLEISMCKDLNVLSCSNCALTSLNVSGLSKLWILDCSYNRLTALDLSGCKNISHLSIDHNPIPTVNVNPSNRITKYWKKLTSEVNKKKGYKRLVYFWKKSDRSTSEVDIHYSKGTRIVNKRSSSSTDVPAVPATFAEVPGAVAAQVTVAANSTAKNTRAIVVAAPGAKTQLDLSGATGKSFKSSNKKVATVTKGGVVTFKKAGKVKITYKVGKKTRKVTLTVTDPTLPNAVAFESVNTDVKAGESVTLTPTVNEGANPGGYKWKSSNKKVATVKNGMVMFKKAGKVTVTCTTKRGKKKARVTFAVSQ